ncbi:putative metalloprotease CJM1_0395 family protein [Parvibaculaceae bacterium PLY_AMNH_Bact1]|nr:putative metalloprotease CJM1_0395 family protein [Parvibaculaceae bacterium PLY_AMNH_Bact1]
MIGSVGAPQTSLNPYLQSASLNSARAGGVFAPSALGVEPAQQAQGNGAGRGLLDQTGNTRKVEGGSSAAKAGPQTDLTPEEEAEVERLKKREEEVKAHEAAHAAAGGGVTGGISYSYTTGPDNKEYITDGEIQINTSAGGSDPASVIAKMEAVIRSAYAPADPSSKDRQVAAQAQQILAAAELQAKEQKSAEGEADTSGDAVAQEGGLSSILSQAIKAYEAPTTDRRQADFSI